MMSPAHLISPVTATMDIYWECNTKLYQHTQNAAELSQVLALPRAFRAHMGTCQSSASMLVTQPLFSAARVTCPASLNYSLLDLCLPVDDHRKQQNRRRHTDRPHMTIGILMKTPRLRSPPLLVSQRESPCIETTVLRVSRADNIHRPRLHQTPFGIVAALRS